jgi:hypothetical protein
MAQTRFGVACRSDINNFYRVNLSQPLLEILIFLGFFRFSPILTLWTLQTAVTRSFMVRLRNSCSFGTGTTWRVAAERQTRDSAHAECEGVYMRLR